MFDTFYHLIKISFDSTIKWTTKFFTYILVVIGLWFLNNTFDFIHFFRINSKLEELEKITVLLNDTTINTNLRHQLLYEREYIANHETVLDYLSLLCDSFPKNISLIKRTTAYNTNTITTISKNEFKIDSVPIRNYLLHFLFSNLLLIILMILIPIIVFKEKKQNISVIIMSTLTIWTIGFIICIIISWFLNFVPIIYNHLWLNYFIDFLASTIFWICILLLIGYYKK